MSVFKNLAGTVLSAFKLGLTGPALKNESGAVAARNSGDTDYANIHAELVRLFGEYIELNAGAAGSSADWWMRLERPTTGMTTNIRIILPTGTPTPDDEIYVVSYSTGVVTLGYRASSTGATNQVHVDSTALAFGTSSPVALVTKPANALVAWVKIIIDTSFDEQPTVSVGIAGQTSKYVAASHVDLTAPAGTVYEIDMGLVADGSTEDIIATYSADSATVGAARIQVAFVLPS